MAFVESTAELLITSARTTGQTVLDSDGKLKNALHNLVPNTDLSDTGDWNHIRVGSVTESGVSPSGKAAYLVTEDATASDTHYVRDSLSFTAGETYSFVFDVKTNGRDITVREDATAFGANVEWSFDISAVTTTQNTAGTNDSASITLISDGWYRCVMTAEATATASSLLYVYLSDGATVSYSGDGASGVYLSRPRVYKSALHSLDMVVNGDFASDISDWTDASEGTGSVAWNASGYIDMTTGVSDANEGRVYQGIPTIVGQEYFLTVDRISGATEINIGTTSLGSDIATIADGTSDASTTFTAVGTTTYIGLRNYSNTSATSAISGVTCVPVEHQGMQLGTDGTDYVATTAGAVYHLGRAYDGAGACLGMQSFEGRTNLQVYSSDFGNGAWSKSLSTITADDATSPDGTVNADLLTDDAATGTGTCSVSDGATITANTDYTWSVYAKADQTDELAIRPESYDESDLTYFDLGDGTILSQGASHSDAGIESVGNGWYRCWIVYQSTTDVDGLFAMYLSKAGSTTITRDGTNSIHLYGAQLEVGAASLLPPYIPTIASSVARGADDPNLLLSSFGFNAIEGTFIVTAKCGTAATNKTVWSLTGSGVNYINSGSRVGGTAAGTYSTWTQAAGVTTANLSSAATVTDNAPFNAAFAYKEDNFGQSVGGSTSVTDTSGVLPVLTDMALGTGTYGDLNGYIKSLVYYPSRLVDATLELESA